jgi:hypothetical protein
MRESEWATPASGGLAVFTAKATVPRGLAANLGKAGLPGIDFI